MEHRVSVVLATYNGERFLEEQLHSLRLQTSPPFELIVSDDNSQDGTDDILSSFATRAPFPVTILKNPSSLGFRENFLHAASKAKGDWIAFCDQDDIWHPEKLRTCERFFSIGTVTQLAHRATLIDPAGTEIGVFNQCISKTRVRAPLSYDVWSTFFGFSMIVRRDVLSVVPPSQRFVDYVDPKHLIAHDRWAFFLAQTLGYTVEIAEPLVAYRQHPGNLYGGRRSRKASPDPRTKNLGYIAATREMVEIIQSLPIGTERMFPAFRRDAAVAIYSSALRQVVARGSVYELAAYPAFVRMLRHISAGHYHSAENGKFRWRSVARDVAFCLGI